MHTICLVVCPFLPFLEVELLLTLLFFGHHCRNHHLQAECLQASKKCNSNHYLHDFFFRILFANNLSFIIATEFVHWGEGAAGTATQGMGKERGTHELVLCFCSICVHHSNALLPVDQCKRNVHGAVTVCSSSSPFLLPFHNMTVASDVYDLWKTRIQWREYHFVLLLLPQ